MMDIMTTEALPLIIAAVLLASIAILCGTALAGWRDWIGLKREALHVAARAPASIPAEAAVQEDAGHAWAGSRIELADMRERLRQLEAIAAGVDL